MHQLGQGGYQIKALDCPVILTGLQFDNFLDCTKNSDAQVCAGVPLVINILKCIKFYVCGI